MLISNHSSDHFSSLGIICKNNRGVVDFRRRRDFSWWPSIVLELLFKSFRWALQLEICQLFQNLLTQDNQKLLDDAVFCAFSSIRISAWNMKRFDPWKLPVLVPRCYLYRILSSIVNQKMIDLTGTVWWVPCN